MSKEEGKLEMATGGISEEEEKLLQALHFLGIKPKVGSVEDITKLLTVFGDTKKEPTESKHIDPSHSYGNYHFPKFPIFYGEEGKGEATWESFKYEVKSLIDDEFYKEEQILLGIRRACKGKAGDSIRRLGTGAKVKDTLEEFESDYSSVESRESIMRKFYGCQQKADESVSSFAARLEEIFDQAVSLKAVKKSDTLMLKEVLHAGLNKELKHTSLYQCDKIAKYDEFKKELRKLESSLKESNEATQTINACKAASLTDSHSKDMSELKDLIKQLYERIDKHENSKAGQIYGSFRGNGRGRGYRGRGRGDRGRGGYQQQRPLANQNFQPTCFICKQKGHKQWNCPSSTNLASSGFTCHKCKQPGHKKANCANA